jgi:hypothetical protein
MAEWCVLRVVGELVQPIGYVWAADEASAIQEAITKFNLTGPRHEIVAHRVGKPRPSN